MTTHPHLDPVRRTRARRAALVAAHRALSESLYGLAMQESLLNWAAFALYVFATAVALAAGRSMWPDVAVVLWPVLVALGTICVIGVQLTDRVYRRRLDRMRTMEAEVAAIDEASRDEGGEGR